MAEIPLPTSDDISIPTDVSIRSHYEQCKYMFEQLSNHLDRVETRKYHLNVVVDEMGRFRVWAAHAGAHRSGRVSLDYRLREALHIHKQVTKLLEELYEDLEDAVRIIRCDGTDSGSEGRGRQTKNELSESSIHDDEISVEDACIDGELFKEVLNDVAHIITSLYNLSVAIQNPFPRERLAKLAAIDVSHFKPWDIQHIRRKFPGAPEYLIERIGEANCRRRQLLRYYEGHHGKISRYIDHPVQDPRPHTTTSTLLQSQTTVTTMKAQAIVSNELPTSDGDHRSQTSYTTSVIHRMCMAIPPPANSRDAFNGQPFQCPYCFLMIKIGNRLSWRKHVLGDLKPYVCTHRDCHQPDKLYDNQHDWYTHEVQFHRREWYCKACLKLFTGRVLFETHLRDRHGIIDTTYMVNRCERAKLTEESCVVCSLCLTSDKMKKHLGRHMVDAALFTLPQTEYEEEDETNSEETTPSAEKVGPRIRDSLGSSELEFNSNPERGSVSKPEAYCEDVTSTGDHDLDMDNSANGMNSSSVLAEVTGSQGDPNALLENTGNEIPMESDATDSKPNTSPGSEEPSMDPKLEAISSNDHEISGQTSRRRELERGEAPSPPARSTERHVSTSDVNPDVKIENLRDLGDYNAFIDWYSHDGTPYYAPIPVRNNEAAIPAQGVWVGSVRPATNDVSTVPAPHGSTHANQMVSRGSADHGSQMTEHQRFRENTSSFYSQTAPFQATTAITPGHGNHKASGGMQSQWREQNLRGTPFIQAPGYPQPSPMQNHLASMGMRDPPPSTLTTSSGVWGSIGGTFSSVSSSDQDGFRRVPDASQSSNLPHPLSQLQITGDNNAGGFGGNMQPSRSSYDVHGYMNGPYGQVPATPQQDQYSHYHTCTHTYCHACHPQAHYPSYGDHAAAVGAVRIVYCPIHGCSRGPGSNRPFPRTCNLLEHLRGVHKEDIPQGAKLRSWLVSQGYDPEMLVEYVKRESQLTSGGTGYPSPIATPGLINEGHANAIASGDSYVKRESLPISEGTPHELGHGNDDGTTWYPSSVGITLGGDHAAVGAVRIGYCPIHGCNRGPGSNRPFPRMSNLLEHLRGVHKEDIPQGAKLRSWLVSQGYDPGMLVEYAKQESQLTSGGTGYPSPIATPGLINEGHANAIGNHTSGDSYVKWEPLPISEGTPHELGHGNDEGITWYPLSVGITPGQETKDMQTP